MALVDVEGVFYATVLVGGSAPSHGRHQMGVNSGVQWDSSHVRPGRRPHRR